MISGNYPCADVFIGLLLIDLPDTVKQSETVLLPIVSLIPLALKILLLLVLLKISHKEILLRFFNLPFHFAEICNSGLRAFHLCHNLIHLP